MQIDPTKKFDIDRAEIALTALNRNSYRMSEERIRAKLSELGSLSTTVQDRRLQQRIKTAAPYLSTLADTVHAKGKMLLHWYFHGYEMISKPVRTLNFLHLGTLYNDFVEQEDNTVFIQYNLSDMLNLLYFSIVYRDWGYTLEEIEDRLKNYGIIGVHSPEVLLDMIDSDDFYASAADLYITDSPYFDDETKAAFDYFSDYMGRQKKYQVMLDSTRYKVCILIFCHLIEQTRKHRYKGFRLVSVTDTSMSALMDGDGKKLDTELIVQVFGRKFILPGAVSLITA